MSEEPKTAAPQDPVLMSEESRTAESQDSMAALDLDLVNRRIRYLAAACVALALLVLAIGGTSVTRYIQDGSPSSVEVANLNKELDALSDSVEDLKVRVEKLEEIPPKSLTPQNVPPGSFVPSDPHAGQSRAGRGSGEEQEPDLLVRLEALEARLESLRLQVDGLEIEPLRARLDELERRLEALASQLPPIDEIPPPGKNPDPDATSNIELQIQDLSRRIQDLEQGRASAGTTMQELSTDLGELKRRVVHSVVVRENSPVVAIPQLGLTFQIGRVDKARRVVLEVRGSGGEGTRDLELALDRPQELALGGNRYEVSARRVVRRLGPRDLLEVSVSRLP